MKSLINELPNFLDENGDLKFKYYFNSFNIFFYPR